MPQAQELLDVTNLVFNGKVIFSLSLFCFTAFLQQVVQTGANLLFLWEVVSGGRSRMGQERQ